MPARTGQTRAVEPLQCAVGAGGLAELIGPDRAHRRGRGGWQRHGDAGAATSSGATIAAYAPAASFPTQDEVLSWDARQLADAAGNWPPAAARQVLCDWLAARGTDGWETLLPAPSAQPSDDIAQRPVTCCAC